MELDFVYNFTKDKFSDAKINIELYRERDSEILKWDINLPYNGTMEVIKPMVNQIKKFLGEESGWIAFSCDTPFIKGYYITDFDKGVIGADHLY